MNCSQCGNPLAPNAKFCRNCGARQAPESAGTAAEKTCRQCQAICKPDARFCTRCGAVFERAGDAAAAVEPTLSPDASQTIEGVSRVPPLIEPMDQPTPRPPLPEPAANPAPRNHLPPAFPQEPVRGSNAWIKWAVLALLIAAIAGGVMMASNMKGLSGTGNSATGTSNAAQGGKDAISAEDKAKADALVGPLGGPVAAQVAPADSAPMPAAVDHVPSTAAAPVATPPDTVSAAPAQAASPQLPAAPASGKPPVPAPARTPPVKKSTAPSLDDLLD
ncbi:MAG: zinc ribbon domain-containing protein [Comamonas sp.]|jgi:RNA polymerase subunit RPABC4/transcription elongation factor Spt4|uniref:zinc ribbon domain-containing protein n=1 Tax=Comamonas sp. TaxID=34028 RepID=UPI00284D2776|nr:zinc-ribbon domain-containing protein [Comamonas sp.]MDR3064380.1 zinc ribbon domain-containing protein [Comamonas sp.]